MKTLFTVLLAAALLFGADSIITSVTKWNHPAKQVFIKYKTPVVSLQLLKNKTYPVFSISGNVKDTPAFWNELAKANGYWSFAVIDNSNIFYTVSADPKLKQSPKVTRQSPLSNYTETVKTSLGNVSIHDPENEQGFCITYKGKQWRQKPDLFYGSPYLRVVKQSPGSVVLLAAYTVTGFSHPVSAYQLVEVTASGCRFFPEFGRETEIYSLRETANHSWIAGCIEVFRDGVDEEGVDRTFYAFTEYTITDKAAVITAGK